MLLEHFPTAPCLTTPYQMIYLVFNFIYFPIYYHLKAMVSVVIIVFIAISLINTSSKFIFFAHILSSDSSEFWNFAYATKLWRYMMGCLYCQIALLMHFMKWSRSLWLYTYTRVLAAVLYDRIWHVKNLAKYNLIESFNYIMYVGNLFYNFFLGKYIRNFDA